MMRTLHRPDRDRGTKGGKCTGSYPECNKSHWFAVPAINVRGTYSVLDMLTDKSALNVLTVYNSLRKGSR